MTILVIEFSMFVLSWVVIQITLQIEHDWFHYYWLIMSDLMYLWWRQHQNVNQCQMRLLRVHVEWRHLSP